MRRDRASGDGGGREGETMKTTVIIKLSREQLYFLRNKLKKGENTKPETLVRLLVLQAVAEQAQAEVDDSMRAYDRGVEEA